MTAAACSSVVDDIDIRGVAVNPNRGTNTDPLLALRASYQLNGATSIGARLQRIFFDREDVDIREATMGWRF